MFYRFNAFREEHFLFVPQMVVQCVQDDAAIVDPGRVAGSVGLSLSLDNMKVIRLRKSHLACTRSGASVDHINLPCTSRKTKDWYGSMNSCRLDRIPS